MSSEEPALDALKQALTHLEEKVRTMRDAHHRLQEELVSLRVENARLLEKIAEQSTAAMDFENTQNVLNVAGAASALVGEKERLLAFLSDYIRKIDYCIKHGGYLADEQGDK